MCIRDREKIEKPPVAAASRILVEGVVGDVAHSIDRYEVVAEAA